MELVHSRVEERIAILSIENPPFNALSTTVVERLRVAAVQAIEDFGADAVVLIGAERTFIAGTDITQLQGLAKKGAVRSNLPQILLEIEDAPKPVAAAIHGNVLGGAGRILLVHAAT